MVDSSSKMQSSIYKNIITVKTANARLAKNKDKDIIETELSEIIHKES